MDQIDLKLAEIHVSLTSRILGLKEWTTTPDTFLKLKNKQASCPYQSSQNLKKHILLMLQKLAHIESLKTLERAQ